MQRLLAQGVPVDDVGKMLAWYAALSAASQAKLSKPFRARITEERIKATNQSGAVGDPDWAAFEREFKSSEASDHTVLAELKKQFQFYSFKQRQCTTRNDAAGASEAMRQIKELGSVIHDMELRAQKLGRDLGDLVPRKDIEFVAEQIGVHLLRVADTLRAEITTALTVRDLNSAPLAPEEIAARLEPILLNAYVLQPIVRAAEGTNTGAPPAWLVAALRAGVASVLELPNNANPDKP